MSQILQLVIRADATPEIGAGHLMRCAAVAEAWLARGSGGAYVWGDVDIAFVARRLNQLGIGVGKSQPWWDPSSVLVVDTYDPAERARLATIQGPRRRILVDDEGSPVPAGYDAVWLPSAAGHAGLYPEFAGTVFTGPESVALRGGLPIWNSAPPSRVGVLLGGGAVQGNVSAALASLATKMSRIQFAAAGTGVPRAWVRLNADDPWVTLARCDHLLAGAGSIMWEAAAVGIPVVLLLTAENQRRNFEWAQSSGVPCVVAVGKGAGDLCQALQDAIPRATPLPRILNGAEPLAAGFDELAGGRRR